MVRVYNDTWSGNGNSVPVYTARVHGTRGKSRQDWTLNEFLSLLPRPLTADDHAYHASNDNALTRASFTVMKCDVNPADGPKLSAQPSMTGWWYCHVSGNLHLNNPDLSPEACSECGHIKCPWCIVEG
ncbi:hypothetical protein I7I51_07855 [Histoplasma capsulatum]|uniref:Uncharacterized protein n=1 Tax=Ajellomyces capsulatus TaxID=5037 RepID=A0A8A1LWY5_AJECA|nr:hypothetical protein I7I51_07855 [Histoplasma capsulatum]